jgi:hypothetical protein
VVDHELVDPLGEPPLGTDQECGIHDHERSALRDRRRDDRRPAAPAEPEKRSTGRVDSSPSDVTYGVETSCVFAAPG